MEFKDRVANKPNRVKLTYEDSGASSYATVELADEPIENGTPLNKATFDEMQRELNAYVVGNVLITSDNTNPSSYLGGTWELIDKEYKSAFIYEDKSNKYYDKTRSTVGDIDDDYFTDNKGLSITRLGHTITFKLTISLNYSIGSDENVTLGFFSYGNMGCTRLAFTPWTLPMAFNDTANNGAFWTLNATSGQLVIHEDLRKAGFKKGDSLSFLANLNIPPEYMLDEFCDKFYWKRIK